MGAPSRLGGGLARIHGLFVLDNFHPFAAGTGAPCRAAFPSERQDRDTWGRFPHGPIADLPKILTS